MWRCDSGDFSGYGVGTWLHHVVRGVGGGRGGVRIVNGPDEMPDMYNTARTEARAAFTDDTVYMEKYLLEPRHIEVQILGDLFGNIITLGERECSIQRRHQKLIEESPSPAITPELRKRICDMALRAARAVGYYNAGDRVKMWGRNGAFWGGLWGLGGGAR